jgi:hypothetical protein
MRACKHYSKLFGETEIVPSDGFGWNGWVFVWNNDRLISSSFNAGIYWEYILHLKHNPKCQEEVRISSEEVIYLLRGIEEEWKKKIHKQ